MSPSGIIQTLMPAILWAAFSPGLSAQRIQIPERVEVDTDQLTLGQIARIEPYSSDLASIGLGYAPYPGHYRWLERSEIESALARRSVDLALLDLAIAEKILITRQSQVVETEQLRNAVEEFFQSRYSEWNVQIDQLELPQEIVLPKGSLGIRIDSDQQITRLDNLTLRADFYVDGQRRKSQWVRLQGSARLPVVVLTRDGSWGDMISDSDLEAVERDLQRIDDLVTDPQEVAGSVLKSAVGRGVPLRRRDLSRPPLIKRGDIVTLIARGPTFLISATGKARASGSAGDMIEVENLDSRQTVRGTITGEKQVRVLTGGLQ